ncbi:MAG: hypothetical protein JXR63_00705 [Spirochaetales bacterium]|nr:hypothetical protein [Spirochaetales bacterium]
MKKFIFTIYVLLSFSCIRFPGVPSTTIPDTESGLLVLNSLSSSISVVDPVADKIFEYAAFAGKSPNSLATSSDKIFVVNSLSNSISIYNRRDFSLLYTIDTGRGSNPWAIEISSSDNLILVTCFLTSELLIFDLLDFSLKKKIKINNPYASFSAGPEGLLVHAGKVYVACTNFDRQRISFGQPFVAVIDLSDFQQSFFPIATLDGILNSEIVNCQNILLFEDLSSLHFVCTGKNGGDDGYLVVYDYLQGEVVEHIRLGGSPFGSGKGVDYSSNRVYLVSENGVISYEVGVGGEISILDDFPSASYPSVVGSGDFISDILFDKDSGSLFAVNFSKGDLYQMDCDDFSLINEWRLSSGILSIFQY